MQLRWKKNWNQTREGFVKWWQHQGVLLGQWTPSISYNGREDELLKCGDVCGAESKYIDVVWRCRNYHNFLAQKDFAADIIPIADTDIGPGSLCLYLGSEPLFSEDTIWYKPLPNGISSEKIVFDSENKWWQLQKKIIEYFLELNRDNYAVGIPDLAEGVDVLASLMGTENLLIDMIERPDLVHQRLNELYCAYFDIYNRIYDMVKLDDGSSFFCAFRLWGPRKVAKLQCDTAAMLSPYMFNDFVVPYIKRQCQCIDNTLFHLDGTQCLVHLESLLAIDELDAIEWTPQAGVEGGGDKRWYDLYRKILEGGKSVQAVGVKPEEVIPLIDAVGAKGMYILTDFETSTQAEKLMDDVLKRI